ncbi:MAG: hypothetical protein IJ087_04580 [Eggerthellaceae bacterium]|nr:hypothetical protein [Eggerthellaceae bacterium]
MANWIKLFLDVDKNSDYRAFEEAMRQGKKGRKQRRIAEDVAFAQVVRLYLLLGQTKEGRLDIRDTGDRLLAEDVMREQGDELYFIFDRMAMHGVINRDFWSLKNIVTTANAVEQAELRQFYKDRSRAGNNAKRDKAKKGGAESKGEPSRTP